jgi:hypothetical protein
MIRELGLTKLYTKRVCNTTGVHDVDVYGTARLTIGDRFCPADVLEVADETPALVGQIPLEYLDYVVDLRGRRLIGNPEHGGEHMFELYCGTSQPAVLRQVASSACRATSKMRPRTAATATPGGEQLAGFENRRRSKRAAVQSG